MHGKPLRINTKEYHLQADFYIYHILNTKLAAFQNERWASMKTPLHRIFFIIEPLNFESKFDSVIISAWSYVEK